MITMRASFLTGLFVLLQSAAPAVTTVKPSPVCAVCGIMKTSGARSCCVRGGAWFKKCGDPGDVRFEHTWTEGVQACKQVSNLFSDKVQSQMVANTSRQPNIPQRNIVNHADNFVSDGLALLGGCVKLSKWSISICFFLAAMHMHRG